MKMPPTIMIGADTMHRAGHEDDRLHLGDVVGAAGDQRGGAEPGDLLGGELADPAEDRGPHVAPEASAAVWAPK